MKKIVALLSSFAILFSSCNTKPQDDLVTLKIQYSSATIPWLVELSICADLINLNIQPELRAIDLYKYQDRIAVLRMGDSGVTSPAYQIGSDDLIVIVNWQNPIVKINIDHVRSLFIGRIKNWKELNGIDAPVEVWVYPENTDVQQTFKYTVLAGSPVSSTARLANTPEEMIQALVNNIDAIGIITRSWKTDQVTDVAVIETLPVLLVLPYEPDTLIKSLITCAQDNP